MRLPYLESLDLDFFEYDDASKLKLDHLAQLPALRRLEINTLAAHPVPDESVILAIARLPTVEEIYLSYRNALAPDGAPLSPTATSELATLGYKVDECDEGMDTQISRATNSSGRGSV